MLYIANALPAQLLKKSLGLEISEKKIRKEEPQLMNYVHLNVNTINIYWYLLMAACLMTKLKSYLQDWQDLHWAHCQPTLTVSVARTGGEQQ